MINRSVLGPETYRLPLEELPDPLPVAPLMQPFDASIVPPGSKSITNRAYVLAALADGESRLVRPLRSDDTDRLRAGLAGLGGTSSWDGDDLLVQGACGRFPHGGQVNLGHGGTPTRFMIAAACLASAPVVIDGSPRMRERPVAEGVELLRSLGARVEYMSVQGHLPVSTLPSPDFKGGIVQVPATQSSQFISALLLVAPVLADGLELHYEAPITSASYVEMTRIVMRGWGIDVREIAGPRRDGRVRTHFVLPTPLTGRTFAIGPDASSAAYWRTAAVITPGARIRIPGLGAASWQPDLDIGPAFAAAGAGAGIVVDDRVEERGPGELRGFEYDASATPDGAMAIAMVAARAQGVTTITGLRTLRVKETDRIHALATELRRIGCTVMTTEDAITIDPSTQHAEPVVVETYDDHRMAMAFATLGLARGGLSIADPKCVEKSYPGFWRDLATLYE